MSTQIYKCQVSNKKLCFFKIRANVNFRKTNAFKKNIIHYVIKEKRYNTHMNIKLVTMIVFQNKIFLHK